MDTIHVSKQDALHNIAALLQEVHRGAEVIINVPNSTPIVMHALNESVAEPASSVQGPAAAEAQAELEWLRASIQEGLDALDAGDFVTLRSPQEIQRLMATLQE